MTDFATATWRKSTRSNTRRECVEVAGASAAIGVRDSKSPQTGHLTLAPANFATLLTHAKSGDLDL
ncbi:DUF397 domain-containing protein [Actinomadura atramentaria]|uniref:DUF397 domain-containing protein n=1 Tax=Actinomadura atramentaria TaxID=1990 RepID=UPI000371D9FC|nr:DUF397 domain-containing protein [Actinomadura atramentaria]